MSVALDSYSRRGRPVLTGRRGASSSSHPLATAAAQRQLFDGGSAADAVIAAQAVLSVVAPESCGLGGDAFFLVKDSGEITTAINASGRSSRNALRTNVQDDGTSVTVPGMVSGWRELHRRWGRLDLRAVLSPAIELAEKGMPVRVHLAEVIEKQRKRLHRGGAQAWPLLQAPAGAVVCQPELARTFNSLLAGLDGFYGKEIAEAVCSAVGNQGGVLDASDFQHHSPTVTEAIKVTWRDRTVYLQPPMSQGILLGMALKGLEKLNPIPSEDLDHLCIELTESVFQHRSNVVSGRELLSQELPVDRAKASRRGGPRAYLHTAGVAAADSTGLVVSSLASVFDDLGSAIYLPRHGFVLNNRGSGFTDAPNEYAPGKSPVHTLAPIIVEQPNTRAALATPGADGQIQALLQVLVKETAQDLSLAIGAPRWRSENASVLIEQSHSRIDALRALGHSVKVIPDGDDRVGCIVCAGIHEGLPFAVADWRREAWAGVA